MTSKLPLLVVTGLAHEARLVAGPDLVTVCSGGSPAHLRLILSGLTPAYRAVVSFGIAGGLDPALAPGDAILARGIVAASGRWAAHPGIVRGWAQHLSSDRCHVIMAEIAGVEAPILTSADKAALHSATGAAAVDMESHVAAAFAAAHGIPFAAIRVICDAADHSLPPLVGEVVGANKALNWLRVLRVVIQQPMQLTALPRLIRDASAAFTSLRRCRTLLGPSLGIASFAKPFSDIS